MPNTGVEMIAPGNRSGNSCLLILQQGFRYDAPMAYIQGESQLWKALEIVLRDPRRKAEASSVCFVHNCDARLLCNPLGILNESPVLLKCKDITASLRAKKTRSGGREATETFFVDAAM
jgi:hypothetical protein